MSGVKGRSGRRTKRDEKKRTKIIEKAWDLIGDLLDSEKSDKMMVAKDIVLKDIIQTVKNTGGALSKKSVNYKIQVIKVDGKASNKLPITRESTNRMGSSEQI